MDPFAPSPVRSVPVDVYTTAYRVSGTMATRFSRVADILNQQTSSHLVIEQATVSEYADPTATLGALQVLVTLDDVLFAMAGDTDPGARPEMRIPKRPIRAQLALPMVCAFAGVAVPALLFTAFNRHDEQAMRGWAVPTATDIAFALGVLALLGSRVPAGMKLLLSTIAVVDDLIAILIIALFYSHGLSTAALCWAGAAIAGMWLLNQRGVTRLTTGTAPP